MIDLGLTQSREIRERGGLFRATLRSGTDEGSVLTLTIPNAKPTGSNLAGLFDINIVFNGLIEGYAV